MKTKKNNFFWFDSLYNQLFVKQSIYRKLNSIMFYEGQTNDCESCFSEWSAVTDKQKSSLGQTHVRGLVSSSWFKSYKAKQYINKSERYFPLDLNEETG